MDVTRKRLADVLAAYGADPGRWPAFERDQLLALLAGSPDLAAEAGEIDQVLAALRQPAVPAGSAARLLARIEEKRPAPNVIPMARPTMRPQPAIWSWGAAAALAASLGLGIFLGTTNFASRFGDTEVVEIDDPIVLTGIDDAPDLLEGDR